MERVELYEVTDGDREIVGQEPAVFRQAFQVGCGKRAVEADGPGTFIQASDRTDEGIITRSADIVATLALAMHQLVVLVRQAVQRHQPVVQPGILDPGGVPVLGQPLAVGYHRGRQPDIRTMLYQLRQLVEDGGLAPADIGSRQTVVPALPIGDHHQALQVVEHLVGQGGVVAELAVHITGTTSIAHEQPAALGWFTVGAEYGTACCGPFPFCPDVFFVAPPLGRFPLAA